MVINGVIVILFIDFEVFKKDWLCVVIDPFNKKETVIVNDKYKLNSFYQSNKKEIWIGHNIRNYDQYIFKSILLDFNPKEVNDFIIVEDRKGWEYSSLFHKVPLIIFDTMPNPPVSLKTLEGFLGKSIHETSVPFDIDRKLTEEELAETIKYCRFDVMNTIEVFTYRQTEFKAQLDLIKVFNLPLSYLGKTQAQLAAVILDAKKQTFNDEWDIRLPENLQLGKYQFVGDWFLDKENHWYERKVPNSKGKLVKQTCDLECEIAGLTHTLAWGGIHAGDKLNIKCSDDEVIYDVDAGQLYPNIMRHYQLLSRSARNPEMLDFVLDTSMRLKAEDKQREREPYKRQCNIFYGAEGDSTNALYDPLHRNLVCVFGQVFIIDLLDKIEDIIKLLNSNTDGIFFKVKKKDIPELNRRVKLWEERTHLSMEFKAYSKFISKDVNNYVALRCDGYVHCKGAYVKELSELDYDLPIVNEAVKNYILYGTPVEDTILKCDDFIKFQKIVKLSNKFQWVEHEEINECWYTQRGRLNWQFGKSIKFDNKAYRVFASTNSDDGRILACRYNNGKLEKKKFGGTADHCFIENGDIRGMKVPSKVDKHWYVKLAKKRLGDFGINI